MKNIHYNNVYDNNLQEVYVAVPMLTNEMIEWLEQYEGQGIYSRGGWGIYFSHTEDATMFTLRWS